MKVIDEYNSNFFPLETSTIICRIFPLLEGSTLFLAEIEEAKAGAAEGWTSL